MDRQWTQLSGIYCSIACARYDNRFVVRDGRTPMDWEQREQWMLEKYQGEHSLEGKRKNVGFH